MRTFRLSDAAFARLAAGRPDAATLDELRRAQLSRHLLQLREILRAAGGKTPQWYAELSAADPEAVRETLADPMTGLWAATILRGGDPSGGEPHALFALSTPTHRVAARDPRAVTGNLAGRDRRSLRAVGGRVLTATHDGLSLRVRLEDTDPLRARLGLPPTGPLSDAAAADWQRHLDGAWRILVSRHRSDAVRLAAVLRVIVPVEPDPGAGGISATSADAFGAVAMSAPVDDVAFAVGLLHETAHSLLNAANFLFDLVRPGGSLGYSPWRDDPRPALGVLHGAYAYQAVTRFWRAEAAAGGFPNDAVAGSGRNGRVAAFEFARWRAAVVEAADGLVGGGELTAAGVRFAGALRDEVAGWLGEPVDAEVARLAGAANADHRARWRLRNLDVEPAAVRALVAAWRAGRAAPPLPPDVLRAGSGRALPHSERLSRIHALLRDPGVGGERKNENRPGSRVWPGDDAYLGGRPGAAHDSYLKVLGKAASVGESAWSGLALVSPYAVLRERPHLVRAVHRELGEGGSDLIAWLDRAHRPV